MSKVSRASSFKDWVIIWDFYKPRRTHTWNMLLVAWKALDDFVKPGDALNQIEYLWENFIIRLWLYRTTARTLCSLTPVELDAKVIISRFDKSFEINGENALKATRDMFEHFDDYATDIGRGPATRFGELDPWRPISQDIFERGKFSISRPAAIGAAERLRADQKIVSDKFIALYKLSQPTSGKIE